MRPVGRSDGRQRCFFADEAHELTVVVRGWSRCTAPHSPLPQPSGFGMIALTRPSSLDRYGW